jgi:Flp pilus assembly protein TadD
MMSPGKHDSKKLSREERRENVLHPCTHLGYDRDSLALYFIEREAFALAEEQLKRAIWLNPFEPEFKVHIAWCLYRMGRFPEARDWVRKALDQKDEPDTRNILGLIERKLDDKGE